MRWERIHCRKHLLILQFSFHLIRHVLLVFDQQGFNVFRIDSVSAQMVDIAVLCNGDKPRAEPCAAARIKFFDVLYHFQKRFLGQIFRKGFVFRRFQEESGNVVVVQPDQLVERLPVAALTPFNKALSSTVSSSFLLSFIYTQKRQKSW